MKPPAFALFHMLAEPVKEGVETPTVPCLINVFAVDRVNELTCTRGSYIGLTGGPGALVSEPMGEVVAAVLRVSSGLPQDEAPKQTNAETNGKVKVVGVVEVDES